MKKIINMNLSGRVITIEEDAYQSLQGYIDSLKNYFANEEGRDEIISDIENRIAEILHDKLKKGAAAITISDVDEIQSSIGRPQDFDSNADNSTAAGATGGGGAQQSTYVRRGRLYRSSSDKIIGGVCGGMAAYFNVEVTIIRVIWAILFFAGGAGFLLYILLWIFLPENNVTASIERRLYRNPDDRMIGGVAGGLASYFGIDVWIPRLIFAFPFLISIIVTIATAIANDYWWGPSFIFSGSFGGTTLAAYIILWLLIPEAGTVSEKMAMRGERANLNTIRDNIQEEMRQFGDRARNFGRDVSDRARNLGREAGDAGRSFGQRAGAAAESAGKGIGNAIALIFKGFFFFITGIIAFSLLIALIAMLIGGVGIIPFSDFFLDGFWQTFFGWGAFIFLLIVPIVNLVVFVARRIRKKPVNKSLSIAFGILWAIGITSTVFFAATMVRDFQDNAQTKPAEIVNIKKPAGNRLVVALKEDNRFIRRWMQFAGIEKFSKDSLQSSWIYLKRTQSPDSSFHLLIVKKSFGPDNVTAQRYAREISYNVSQQDSVLYLDGYYSVLKGSKFRGQHITLELQVPVGATTFINEEVYEQFNRHGRNTRIRVSKNGRSREWYYDEDSNWEAGVNQTMTKDGAEPQKKNRSRAEIEQELRELDEEQQEDVKQRKIDSIERVKQRQIDSIENSGR